MTEKELTEYFILNHQGYKNIDEYKAALKTKDVYKYPLLRHLNAYILYRGVGIKQDKELADLLIKSPSDSGFWKSFYMGYLLPKDRELAIHILEKNAALNDLNSAWFLTYLYDGYFDESEKNPERKALWEKRKDELIKKEYQKSLSWKKQYIDDYDEIYLDAFSKKIPETSVDGKPMMRYNYDGLRPAILALTVYGSDKFAFTSDVITWEKTFANNPFANREKAEETNKKFLALNDAFLYFHIGKYLRNGNAYDTYLQELGLMYIKKAAEMKLRAAEYYLKTMKK